MREIKLIKRIKGVKFKIDLDLRPRVFILATIELAILLLIIKLIMRQ